MLFLLFVLFQDDIKVDYEERVSLVRLSLKIHDPSGSPLTPKAEELKLFENGTQLPIQSLEPLNHSGNLLILFDLSASQIEQLPLAQQQSIAILERLGDKDQIALATFSGTFRYLQEFGTDRQKSKRIIEELETTGSTALFDGIAASLKVLAQQNGPKVLLIFSDGYDLLSRTTESELRAITRSYGIPIVLASDQKPPSKGGLLSQQANFMQELCQATGGALLRNTSSRNLAKKTLSHFEGVQVTYHPLDPLNESLWRAVLIQYPNCPECRLEYRRGYRLDD